MTIMEKFIKNLAKGAGAILREGFRKKLRLKFKQDFWDVVTQYDLASEDFLVGKIKARYPNHGIISEEGGGGAMTKKKEFWLIDPLDGTRAFSRGLSHFCVSIAFVSRGELKYGAVYAPMDDELFFGQRHKGAFLNNKSISVTKTDSLKYATIALIMGTARTSYKENIFVYDAVLKNKLWPSNVESAALSAVYPAAGRYDIYISKGLYPWDYSAAALILREAGAKVTDFEGRSYQWDSESIMAANPVLHKKIMATLHKK